MQRRGGAIKATGEAWKNIAGRHGLRRLFVKVDEPARQPGMALEFSKGRGDGRVRDDPARTVRRSGQRRFRLVRLFGASAVLMTSVLGAEAIPAAGPGAVLESRPPQWGQKSNPVDPAPMSPARYGESSPKIGLPPGIALAAAEQTEDPELRRRELDIKSR